MQQQKYIATSAPTLFRLAGEELREQLFKLMCGNGELLFSPTRLFSGFVLCPHKKVFIGGSKGVLGTSAPSWSNLFHFYTFSATTFPNMEMPSHSQQWRLHPWNCSRLASQVLHTNAAPNCFYPALSGCFVVKCTFSLLFFFSAHHVSSSVLTARD